MAAAVGALSAYALLCGHPAAPERVSAPSVALLPTASVVVASMIPGADGAAPQPADRERSGVIASYRDAVSRVSPSVVTVHSAHTSSGPLPLSPRTVVRGLGSGVIVDHDGQIVTNHHVVEDASQLAVALPDGSLHFTRVIGTDPESHIALLKIDVAGLSAITPADINDVAVDDVVLAVGNPLGVGQTVPQGIVSAIVREGMDRVDNFIQTDAAINPENSGGALVDTAGRLVGINVAILSRSGGSEGIGFAIPVDYVQMVATALKTTGHVTRAWLGVSTAPLPGDSGALVVAVERAGPADRAGIVAGDVIVRISQMLVRHAQDARSVVIGANPGSHVAIEILRNGKHEVVELQLAAVPAPPAR